VPPDPPFLSRSGNRGDFAFASCDWTARYLEGGEKGFVFHTVATHPHALAQSSRGDTTTASGCAPLLQACAGLGVLDFLQLDPDAAFTSLGKTLGERFVRLALDWDLELSFMPPGAPQRNALVEGLPSLWAQSFWQKTHFPSVSAFQRTSPQGLARADDSDPPARHGLSVKEARPGVKRGKLPPPALQRLPPDLPLTASRVHFLRRVNARGVITIRKEKGQGSRRLAGE
jgi:hypothetical protein